MADKELNINIRTLADTNGVDQTAEALEAIKIATEENTEVTKANTKEREKNAIATKKQSNALTMLGKKGEQAGDSIAKGSKKGADGVKNMGRGALQVAYFFDDLQYGLRGIMNNIPQVILGFGGGAGLAGVITMAIQAASFLYTILDKTVDKGQDAAKKAAEMIEAEKERIKKLAEEVANLRMDESNTAMLERELSAIRAITEERKAEAEALEYAFQYRKRLIDLESGIADDEAEIARLKVEEDFAEGKYGTGKDAERTRQRLLLGIEVDSNARRRAKEEEKIEIDASSAFSKRIDANRRLRESKEALKDNIDEDILNEKDRKKIEVDINDESKVLLDVVFNLIKQARDQAIDNGALRYKRLSDKDIFNNIKQWEGGGGMSNKLVSALFENYEKNDVSSVKSRRDKILELQDKISISDTALENKGFNLGDGSSGEKGYEAAYKKYWETITALREEYTKAGQKLCEAEETDIEVNQRLSELKQKHASEKEVDLQRLKTQEAKEKRQIKDEEEKRLEQEQKKKQQGGKKSENNQLKSLVDGIFLDTGSSSPQQAVAIKKAINETKKDVQDALANDGKVDSVELTELIKILSAKLQENGIASQNSINLLCSQFSEIIKNINNQTKSYKELERRVLNSNRREKNKR